MGNCASSPDNGQGKKFKSTNGQESTATVLPHSGNVSSGPDSLTHDPIKQSKCPEFVSQLEIIKNHENKQRENVSLPSSQASKEQLISLASNRAECLPPAHLCEFSLRELSSATSKFSQEYLLGEGGFGKVFKGYLSVSALPNKPECGSGERICAAIKKLELGGSQGHKEWLAEVDFLGNLHHPNLVQLYGYCSENGERILVYEFVGKGSLDYTLFVDTGSKEMPSIPWNLRLKIALDSAIGLDFLHKNNVIHRDFKASNILLDEEWTVKLTDFGLSKSIDTDQTHVTTRIMGTPGYLDPNYIETAQLTKKSDVYAFGVLLLELLTGRRAEDERNTESPRLTVWALEILRGKDRNIFDLADPRLHDELQLKHDRNAARKLAIIAHRCIDGNPDQRPSMSDVVDMLRPLSITRKSVGSKIGML